MDTADIRLRIALQEQAIQGLKLAALDYEQSGSQRRKAATKKALAEARRQLATADYWIDEAARALAAEHNIRLLQTAKLQLVLKPDGSVHLLEFPNYGTGKGCYVFDTFGNLVFSDPPDELELRIYLV